MDDSGSQTVQLYIYDLTSGMAAMMSQMLVGRHIEGIWHTAVVIYGREYFYGGQGIQMCMPVSSSLRFANLNYSVFRFGRAAHAELISSNRITLNDNAFYVFLTLSPNAKRNPFESISV